VPYEFGTLALITLLIQPGGDWMGCPHAQAPLLCLFSPSIINIHQVKDNLRL